MNEVNNYLGIFMIYLFLYFYRIRNRTHIQVLYNRILGDFLNLFLVSNLKTYKE